MNKRQARRLVARRVAAAVRALNDFDEFGSADRRRLLGARDDLAQELEQRAGMQREAAVPSPGQFALMTIEDVIHDHRK